MSFYTDLKYVWTANEVCFSLQIVLINAKKKCGNQGYFVTFVKELFRNATSFTTAFTTASIKEAFIEV